MRVAGTLLAAFWLVVFGLLVAGYIAGAQPTLADGPEIDHSDPPNEVAADALRQLQYRDHTMEHWFFTDNQTTGARSGGILFRIHVQHSERRYRMIMWGDTTLPTMSDNETAVVTPDQQPPDYELFGNDNFYRWQWNSELTYWMRNRRAPMYDEINDLSIGHTRSAVSNASGTVVADNESVLAVRVTDPEALSRIDDQFGRYGRNSSMTVVVAKGENPHLTRVTLRNHTAAVEETIYIRNVGTATAPRPEQLPPVAATETAVRISRGLDELFD